MIVVLMYVVLYVSFAFVLALCVCLCSEGNGVKKNQIPSVQCNLLLSDISVNKKTFERKKNTVHNLTEDHHF